MGKLEGKFVAQRTTPADNPNRKVRKIGSPAKRFPPVDVRQMDLHKRNVHGAERIPDGNAGMRKGRRIDNNEVDGLVHRLMDPVHKLMLGIALKQEQLATQGHRFLFQTGFYLTQGIPAIDPWLPSTQEIDIGPVQQ